MKDEWYGDKRDLVKWSILVHLADQIEAGEILQVAYWSQSEWGSVVLDGEDHPIPASAIQHFRSITNVASLETHCPIRIITEPFTDREKYLEHVLEAIEAAPAQPSIVFLDPDTGLAPKKANKTHVLESELRAIWCALRPGDLLVFYQHQTNRDGSPWIEPKREQFEAALALPEGMVKLARAPAIARDVAFFYCTKA